MKASWQTKAAARVRVHRLIGAMLLTLTGAVIACSSGPSESGDETAHGIQQFIGNSTCPTAPPQATFQGAIDPMPTIPASARAIFDADQQAQIFNDSVYNTGSSYTNPKCYHAAVVRVENWLNSFADLVIEPPKHGSTLALTKAQCQSRGMTAFIYGTYADGSAAPTLYRDVPAKWIPPHFPTTAGGCQEPQLVFGGFTSQPGPDWELFASGATYQITATYRDSTRPNAMLPMNIYTRPNACGQPGTPCCTVEHPASGDHQNIATPFCVDLARCDGLVAGAQCEACGGLDQPACGGDAAGEFRACAYDFLIPDAQNICRSCGTQAGASCCVDNRYHTVGSHACADGLYCADSLVCQPGSRPEPPPSPSMSPPPSAPPTVSGPNRCNGQAHTSATTLRLVKVEAPFGCGTYVNFFADNDAEAAACAAALGYTVMPGDSILTYYTECVYSSSSSPTEMQYQSYSADAAYTCAQYNALDSAVAQGPCP